MNKTQPDFNPNDPLIRVIGDPILHQPGIVFPDNPTPEQTEELLNQIEHAKSVLTHTGGAGMAANQCAQIAKPYRFTIVGIFYDVPEHVATVTKRYPNAQFPEAKTMLNPEILSHSERTQTFYHGCLSIPGSNRWAVKSPQTIHVSYKDPINHAKQVNLTVSDTDAVVLWHEFSHILDGKTYIEIVFRELDLATRNRMEDMMLQEKTQRQTQGKTVPQCTFLPPFHHTIHITPEGLYQFDEKAFLAVLPQMTDQTLTGLLSCCEQVKMYA
jgi:peptide deformylase